MHRAAKTQAVSEPSIKPCAKSFPKHKIRALRREKTPSTEQASSKHRASLERASSMHRASIEQASSDHQASIERASSEHRASIKRASSEHVLGSITNLQQPTRVLCTIQKHIASILGFWKKKLKKNKDDDFAK